MARHALVAGHKKFGRYACALTQPPPRTADCAPMLAVCVAALALTTPPTGLWSRRGSLAAGVAAATLPRPSSAFNIITYVTQLEKDATKKTAADFTQVIEMRPISGPSGVKNALVLIDAGNAGDFDYVWLKNAKTGKVLGVASKAAPPPMIVRVAVERGQIVRGVAYSKEAGLWEGDPFEVRVGEYRPQGMYEGRPDGPIGVFGEPLYR